MPILNGFKATSMIKKEGARNAATPIIALTANAMAGDRERCLEGGMDDYLSKPYSVNGCRRRKLREQLFLIRKLRSLNKMRRIRHRYCIQVLYCRPSRRILLS